ncbi:YcdB/YcdC domain-containing protein [Clostridium lundense]|uniref:YcdB/YcdC domain-containing protein n=1 Tax=Clostridium lundense TaxID=319475 RepID=UPI00048958D5|nr:YcdB/YcdC domain-containing protein [Clostridium lundense]
MKSKKLIALVLGTVLTITNYSAVFASDVKPVENKNNANIAAVEKEAKISKDEAKNLSKKILKDYFNVTIDEKKYECSVEFSQSYEDKNYFWQIYWRKNDSNSNTTMEVFVNAFDGKILRASKREYIEGQTNNIAKITEEEGRKKAEAFLQKINPKEFKETKYVKSNTDYMYKRGDNTYSYTYSRYINGVKYNENSLVVEVDGIKGEVISYYINWDANAKVPSTEGIIAGDKADEIIKKDLSLELLYIPYRDKYESEENGNKTKLVYRSKFSNGGLLDAKEGKFINDTFGKKVEKDLTDKEKKDYLSKIKINKPLDKEISKDRAVELARQKIKELYGEGYEINNVRYNENREAIFGAKNTWSIDFEKKQDKNKVYDGGQIAIDALNENIVNLYKNFRENEKEATTMTWEQAYNKAIEFIVKYAPEKFKDINTKQTNYIADNNNMYDKRYHFNFVRTVNGIPYDGNYIDISIDAVKGELCDFRINWNEDAKFSEANNLINKEEGKNTLFSKYKPELNYMKISKNNDPKKPEFETKLVYKWNNFASVYYSPLTTLDAFTGKILNDMGEEIDENIDKFMEKIKVSPYKNELTILAYNGVMDTVNFEANKEITQMDFIKMLVNAKGYRPYLLKEASALKFETATSKNDTNYKYLQLAVLYGIVENKEGKFDINSKVTREDMAKALVKFLGYEKLANSKDIFQLKINDAKEIKNENLGYMGIAKGLGILEVKDNKIRPKANATWTDLSIAIYRVLDNIRR